MTSEPRGDTPWSRPPDAFIKRLNPLERLAVAGVARGWRDAVNESIREMYGLEIPHRPVAEAKDYRALLPEKFEVERASIPRCSPLLSPNVRELQMDRFRRGAVTRARHAQAAGNHRAALIHLQSAQRPETPKEAEDLKEAYVRALAPELPLEQRLIENVPAERVHDLIPTIALARHRGTLLDLAAAYRVDLGAVREDGRTLWGDLLAAGDDRLALGLRDRLNQDLNAPFLAPSAEGDVRPMFPLELAARRGNATLAASLLERGADPLVTIGAGLNLLYLPRAPEGENCLLTLARAMSTASPNDIRRLRLELNRPLSPEDGTLLLSWARQGSAPAVRALTALGARLGVSEEAGRALVLEQFREWAPEKVRALVLAGADLPDPRVGFWEHGLVYRQAPAGPLSSETPLRAAVDALLELGKSTSIDGNFLRAALIYETENSVLEAPASRMLLAARRPFAKLVDRIRIMENHLAFRVLLPALAKDDHELARWAWVSDRQTLLHKLVGHPEARGLLEAGADPNVQDLQGRTPMMLLSSVHEPTNETLETARALLNHGADMNLRDEGGRDAADHFKRAQHARGEHDHVIAQIQALIAETEHIVEPLASRRQAPMSPPLETPPLQSRASRARAHELD